MNRPLPHSIRLAVVLAALFGLAPLPASADFLGLGRLFKDWGLFQGLQVSGSNDFTFQQSFIQGSSTAYENQRWDTQPFMRRTTLSLEGPIWKELAFKADLSYSGYGPAYSRWVVGYIGGSTALYYGDLNIDLSGNQFCSFSKPVQGWQLDQKLGKGVARFFYSQEKAITRYQTVTGNNTTGPFFLTYTPVMQGTEIVKVNEQPMEFGKDYRLDYDTGQLWFEVEGRPPRIIPDTATITISYQSAGYDSSTGTLYGGRLLMPFMDDRLQVGVTMLKQDRGGDAQRDTVGYQEDIFNGSGSTGPFDVNFRPIVPNGTNAVYQGEQQVIQQALLVLVDNIEQAEGVDYDSYRQIGRIIFRRSVPPTSLVIIRYFYDLSTSLPATDNELLGVDLLYHFTPQLGLQAEWGRSDGGLSTNTGDALRLNLAYTGNKLKVISEYREVSPTFSFLDSVGFYRQDRGYEVGVNWQPMQHVSLFARRSDLKTNQGYSFGYSPYGGYGGGYYGMQLRAQGVYPQETTTPSLSVGSQRSDYELRLDFPHWPTFALQRQELTNRGGTGADSKYSGNNFSLNWSPSGQPFSVSANYSDTDQSYAAVDDPGAFRGSKTQQLQWSASYRPSERIALSYNQGRNQSRAVDAADKSSSSTDQVSVHWTPFKQLDINYDLTMTKSVGSVSSGFYTPPGGNYGGGIGGGGGGIYVPPSTGTDGDTSNRYNDNSSRLGVRFSPTDRLNLDYSWTQRKYSSGGSVGYLADSDQSTQSFNVGYMLTQALSLNATYNMDRMDFLEEGHGSVVNNTLGFGANYQPPGSRWGFGLYYNNITGSSPTYMGFGANQRMRIVDNNMSDLRGQITYALSDDTRLMLVGQLSDYAGGYANFNRQQLEVGLERALGSSARLQFGYRFMRNITTGLDDPRFGNTSLTPQNQNYLANSFLVTFSTQFTSGIGGGRGTGISGFGGSSLGGFTGYRAGTGGMGPYGSGYGTGYGAGGLNQLGVFGTTSPVGGGYRSPFGSTPFGGGSYGGYGGSGGYGGYGGYGGAFGSGQPQGYETFGTGFRGDTGGLGSGFGDVSGRRQPGVGGVTPPPSVPSPPGATTQDDELLKIEDWQMLDDLYSIWW